MKKLNAIEILGRRSKAFLVTVALLVVAALAVLNYLSGPDVSFLIFYIAPVFLTAWFVGRRAGLLMCACVGLTWFVVAELTSDHYSSRAVPFWNAAVTLGFIVTLTLVVAAFKRSHEKERELARTDYLTGAFNGRAFAEAAEAEINRARRNLLPFTVFYMDVDDFKLVNDRDGHSTGDRLLRVVAETIRESVRTIDVVARLGGDEFAVLLPETDGGAAEVVIRRVRRQLTEAARAEGWPVTFSLGVVTWDVPPASLDEMLRAADGLMYAAKRNGKNRILHKIWSAPATAA
ncbi:MAG TPA: GGDEF domain-containing protein [Pyrinomonadaceae bacterium]|nr:GGDEF domain-containing protein [Pyrinomonadaceae bacterium]